LTFGELQNKYGGVVDRRNHSGAFHFKFENSVSYYTWETDGILNQIPDFDFENPIPPLNNKMSAISDISIDEIFIGLELPATISDIVEKYETVHESSDYCLVQELFFTMFVYDDILIRVATHMDSNTLYEYLLFDEDSPILIWRNC
jgi:hypothetical protein